MYLVGQKYLDGEDGFDMDDDLALSWLKKAHSAGYIKATTEMAMLYGEGAEENLSLVYEKQFW